MAGLGLKCSKCNKIFRMIHGIQTDKLHEVLSKKDSEIFYGEDFFCCGKENIKTLHSLGMNDEIIELQRKWLKILLKIHEDNSPMFNKIKIIDEKMLGFVGG